MLKSVLQLLFACVMFTTLCKGNAERNLESYYRYGNGAFFTKHNHILPGNSIASLFLPSMITCSQKCLKERTCVGFNYQLRSEDGLFGLCELKDSGIDNDGGEESLRYKFGFVFSQLYAKDYMPTSCLDHIRNGATRSGLYVIYDNKRSSYQVYCDLTSEPTLAWTLVMSQTFQNRALPQFRSPMFQNSPLNQESPRWDAFRLSLQRMNAVKSDSTHWRVTCNFPTEGLQYRDYVRANFAEFDAVNFKGGPVCKRSEYMNVRGHNCTRCTAAWWHGGSSNFPLHHDSSYDYCEFGSSPGFSASEDNFGYYFKSNRNPNFRCTSTKDSSTNVWFGGYL